MPEPLSPEQLEEIRDRADSVRTWKTGFCAEPIPQICDEDVPALIDEVKRLRAQVSLMGTYLQRESLNAIDKALAAREAAG